MAIMVYLSHSAKGSEWEDHDYVKKVDGKYYYKSGDDRRTLATLNKEKTKSSGSSALNRQIVGDGSDLDNMAISVIRGNYGNGEERKKALGDAYRTIQDRVNQLLGFTTQAVSEVSEKLVVDQNISESVQETIENLLKKNGGGK